MELSIIEFHLLLIEKHPHLWVHPATIRRDCKNGVLIGAEKLTNKLWMIPDENIRTYHPKSAKPCFFDRRSLTWRRKQI